MVNYTVAYEILRNEDNEYFIHYNKKKLKNNYDLSSNYPVIEWL
jgi:hypothetical protein